MELRLFGSHTGESVTHNRDNNSEQKNEKIDGLYPPPLPSPPICVKICLTKYSLCDKLPLICIACI